MLWTKKGRKEWWGENGGRDSYFHLGKPVNAGMQKGRYLGSG